jgi:hypothetical protein
LPVGSANVVRTSDVMGEVILWMAMAQNYHDMREYQAAIVRTTTPSNDNAHLSCCPTSTATLRICGR